MEIKNKCFPVSLFHKIVESGKTMENGVFSLNSFVIHVTNIYFIPFSLNCTRYRYYNVIATMTGMVGAKCETKIVKISTKLSFFM